MKDEKNNKTCGHWKAMKIKTFTPPRYRYVCLECKAVLWEERPNGCRCELEVPPRERTSTRKGEQRNVFW